MFSQANISYLKDQLSENNCTIQFFPPSKKHRLVQGNNGFLEIFAVQDEL
jgi:hypothetical protein